jgi:hypothetical protein
MTAAYRDIVETWMWLRFLLYARIKTPQQIAFNGRIQRVGDFPLNTPSGYPIDCSFIDYIDDPPESVQMEIPASFEVDSVTFLFSNRTSHLDLSALRDNYVYRLWIGHKWYHQGPLRIFPVVADLDDPEKCAKTITSMEGPWKDDWDPPETIPCGMRIGITLEGVPFTPAERIDVLMGIHGKYIRSVQ